MKTKIFTAIFLMLSLLWISDSFAQYPGRYQRKKITPSFFIPESAKDKPEKLPEFIMPPTIQPAEIVKKQTLPPTPQNISDENDQMYDDDWIDDDLTDDTQTADNSNQNDVFDYPNVETPENNELTVFTNIMFDKNNKYVKMISEYDFSDLPLYKKKYDEYIDDLRIIGETGKVPENKTLEKDLSAMDTNLKTIVDDNFGIK